MPRLDTWLVEQGYFSSRQAAKRAIRAGHVKIDGEPAKASKQIRGSESVTVSKESLNVPVGYLKLKQIDDSIGNVVTPTTLALDIGSSAGGFLTYLAECGATAIGVEVSEEFAQSLEKLVNEYPKISVLFDDAFTLDTLVIDENEQIDLLLIDVTTEPQGTLTLVKKFSVLLKKEGWLVAAFKSKTTLGAISNLCDSVASLGFTIVQDLVLDAALHEFHVVAVRQ
ncbi:MAG: S4 domain-containing protein [Candidatus Thorarchaeota archaeon]|jgi:23S rRNA (cytidine1920-2'-O)/16S rRNA (cytidine1409-2'-O)-methyltransferase